MLFPFAELVGHQRQQRTHRDMLIGSAGFKLNGTANASGQHHHAHDAFGIYAALAFGHPDLTGKTACKFGKFGRRPCVQAQLIADVGADLDHGF